MITFYQLESFCKIVEEGSFHAAADKLNISQPSVSQHVASLERHLRTRLFVRRGRKNQLTPEGRLLFATANEILEKIGNLEDRFRDLQKLEFGELKMGCTGFTGTHVLPSALELFRRRYGRVRISVATGRVGEIMERLRDGDVELVILGRDLNWSAQPGLTYKTILRDEFLFVASPSHTLAGQQASSMSLKGETLITFSERNSLNSYLRSFLLMCRHRPHQVIEVDDLAVGTRLARKGLGILLTSRLAVSEELTGGTLLPLDLEDWERPGWQIDAIYHSGRGLSYAGWEMLKILQNMKNPLPEDPA